MHPDERRERVEYKETAARIGRATTESKPGNVRMNGERCMETLRHLSKVLSELFDNLSPMLIPEGKDLPEESMVEATSPTNRSEVAMQIDIIGKEIAEQIRRIERVRGRIDL